MKYWSLLVLFLWGLSAGAQILRGNEVRNGGAGIFEEGRYMTFYSAHIPVGPSAEKAADIPGLSYLLEKVNGMALAHDVKARLLYLIFPFTRRAYYRVDEKALTEQNRQEILHAYSHAMNLPEGQIVIFAATDRLDQSTFLFPEFYKLTPVEQAVILLHEAIWIEDATASYDSVLGLEQAAQAYFENPDDVQSFTNFYFKIASSLGSAGSQSDIYLRAALSFDKAHASIAPGSPYEVLGTDLFGKDFIECEFATETAAAPDGRLKDDVCTSEISLEMIRRMQTSQLTAMDLALLQYFSRPHGLFFMKVRRVMANSPSARGRMKFVWLEDVSDFGISMDVYEGLNYTRIGNLMIF